MPAGHRAGGLKQSNKKHKHGKHKSKGALDLDQKGKIERVELKLSKNYEASRMERRNRAKQIRNNKRSEALSSKRLCGGIQGPSQVIAIVPLSADVDIKAIKSALQNAALVGRDEKQIVQDDSEDQSKEGMVTCLSTRHKHKFSLIECPRDIFCILETIKTADLVLFALSCNSVPDEFGEQTLTAMRAFGMPACVSIVQGMSDSSMTNKKRNEIKKAYMKYCSTNFQQDKLFSLDTENEGQLFIRYISNMKRKPLLWSQAHSYILADGIDYDKETMRLKVKGYVRGAAMSANQVVSIRNCGDFLIEKITSAEDPYSIVNKQANSIKHAEVDLDLNLNQQALVLSMPESDLQETLQSELVPNELDNEQTFPTDVDMSNALAETEAFNRQMELENSNMGIEDEHRILRLPKGTSKYQSAWMVEEYEESQEEYTDVDIDEKSDNGFGADDVAMNGSDDEFGDEESDVIGSDDDCDEYDRLNSQTKDMVELQKIQQEKFEDDFEFPDEIDTPVDVPARERFANYRGLKSFRDSKWDKYESLPQDYSRLYKLENYKHMAKLAKKEHKACVQVGSYVEVSIANVPESVLDSFDQKLAPLVLLFLLRFENKMSVVNMSLTRNPGNDTVLKSKDDVVYVTPLRMFSASTLFSENTRYDKFKLNRYFHSHYNSVVATCYAPIMYNPCPVLAFAANEDTGKLELVATGKVMSVDPDRVITKRAVLSGYFYKLNVKTCVLRFMFFNREDIEWFKPIELTSKDGLRGHIKVPLGTHGHMKAAMNGKIQSDDVICMNLYKRVFPKWNYKQVCYYRSSVAGADDVSSSSSSSSNCTNTNEEIMDFMD